MECTDISCVVFKSEEPRCRYCPVVVFHLHCFRVDKAGEFCNVVHAETIGTGNLEVFDEFNAKADVPCYLTGLGLDCVDRVLVEFDGERGAGEYVRSNDAAYDWKANLILKVEGNFKEVLVV